MIIEKQYELPFPISHVYAAWVSSDTVIPPATSMDVLPEVGGHYRLIMEMPDFSGIEVLRELRAKEETKDIPVFMLTSKNLVSDVELAFEMGALEYLSKPLDLNLISKKIRSYMKANRDIL